MVDCTQRRVCMIDYQLANNMAVFVLGFFIAGATGGLSVSGGAVLVPLITPQQTPQKMHVFI